MPAKPVPVAPAFSRSPEQRGAIRQIYSNSVGASQVPIEAYPLYEAGPDSIEGVNAALKQRAGPGK